MLEVRGARSEELDAAAECIGMVFSETPEAVREVTESIRSQMSSRTRFDPENTRVAVVDGRVVSVLQISDRHTLVQGVPVRTGVVIAMGTLPEYRADGYGALVLWDAARYLERRGYELSLVLGETVDFYERGGWRKLRAHYSLLIGSTGGLREAHFGGELRPIDWASDLDSVLALQAICHRSLSGPTAWGREYWIEAATRWEHGHPMFYVAKAGGELLAYLRVGGSKGIEDFCARPGAHYALSALIVHAHGEALAAGLQEIESVRLLGMESRLGEHGLDVRRDPESQYNLYRIVRLDSLLELLVPRMQEEWERSGLAAWEGSVTIESEAGDAHLAVRDDRVLLADERSRPGPEVRVRLTHAQLIDLLFGQTKHDKLLIETKEGRSTALRVLQTLFPAHEFLYVG